MIAVASGASNVTQLRGAEAEVVLAELEPDAICHHVNTLSQRLPKHGQNNHRSR